MSNNICKSCNLSEKEFSKIKDQTKTKSFWIEGVEKCSKCYYNSCDALPGEFSSGSIKLTIKI